MKSFKLFCITAMLAIGSHVSAVPIESTGDVTNESAGMADAPETADGTKAATTGDANNEDLEAANSGPEPSYVQPGQHSSGGPPHFDPSIYAGYLTPEAFQQYLAQFTGAFAPYPYPGYASAPAPVYPAPYTVQTGYDGFLLPSVSTSLSASGSTSSTSIGSTIFTALQNLLPNLMSSTIFQMIITALMALGMVIFSGAITTAICNLTPLCDISFKAVTYLRSNGAADMGRMLAEEMTPDRVRRASEFVRKAIHKYKELQKVMIPVNELE